MAGRPLSDAVVVITGASSGIGRAAAVAFAGQGSRLVLAARGREALDDAAAASTAAGAPEVLAVPTDITDTGASYALARRATERFGRIDVWVEAAAVLIVGRFEDHPPEDLRRLIDTNIRGTALGAQAALRVFRSQHHGVLVIVSSLLGLWPSPLVPAYAMSRFAARGLALSLRQGVADEPDVHVALVLPGPVDTPIYERAANYTGRELRAIPPAYAPERLAAAIVACARRPRRQTTAGLLSWTGLLAHRLAPRPTEWVVGRWSARVVTRAASAEGGSGVLDGPREAGAVHGGWRRGRLRRRLGELAGAVRAR